MVGQRQPQLYWRLAHHSESAPAGVLPLNRQSRRGEAKGTPKKFVDLRKLIDPVGGHSGWESGRCGDLCGGSPEHGVVKWEGQRAARLIFPYLPFFSSTSFFPILLFSPLLFPVVMSLVILIIFHFLLSLFPLCSRLHEEKFLKQNKKSCFMF